MKTVVSSDNVAHLWAHKVQETARNGKSSIFFEGDTIYSYGHHFPMARHVKNKRGQSAILVTTRTYSVTTLRHQSIVRSSIPHSVPVFYVDDVTKDPEMSDAKDKETQAAEYLVKAKRARTSKDFYLSRAGDCLNDATKLVSFFDIPYNVQTPDGLKDVAAVIEEQKKKEAKEKRERQARELADAKAKIEAWKTGAFVPSYFFNKFDCAFGRIEGEEFVTSRGARVPLEHVKKAWPLVKRLIEKGETYVRNGHTIHLGPYALDRIDKDGTVTAGCHRFTKEEVLRIGKLLER